MSDDEVDDRVESTVKDEVKHELETEDGAIFSKTEVMRALRDRIGWKGNAKDEALADMYERGQISRRKFLTLLGLGIGGAVVASSGTGYFFGKKIFDDRRNPTGFQTNVPGSVIADAPGDQVVEASSFSEACDAFTDGNTVVLQQGTYDITSGTNYGGSKSNCSLIGDGEVTLERSEDERIRPTIDGGNVRLQNFTIRGKMGQEQSRVLRIDANEGETVDMVNVNAPDGSVDCSDSQGVYCGRDSRHAGTARIINCSFHTLGNSAVYVTYSDGNVIVDSCYFKDVIASYRPSAASGNVITNAVWNWENTPPRFYQEDTGGGCQGNLARGIKTEESSPDLLIENNDFFMQSSVGNPGACIQIQDDYGAAAGTMRGITIRNDTDAQPIIFDSGVGPWDAQDICVFGDGNTNVPGEIEGAVSSDCSSVRTNPPQNDDWMNTTPGASSAQSDTQNNDSGNGSGSSIC